jgi:hypothetical protein
VQQRAAEAQTRQAVGGTTRHRAAIDLDDLVPALQVAQARGERRFDRGLTRRGQAQLQRLAAGGDAGLAGGTGADAGLRDGGLRARERGRGDERGDGERGPDAGRAPDQNASLFTTYGIFLGSPS